jgi:CMP-N,N'-diacetyllegionaminic acid synthase
MRMIGIIPARGGSKGIPKKNLALVGKRSLLSHAIDAAVDSRVLDRVIVDSDDDEIIAAARSHAGVEVPYKRPAALATADATTADTVRHGLAWLRREQDYVPDALMLLEPTCPLRTAADVAEAFHAFQDSGCPCLLTVSPPLQHPNSFVTKSGDGWRYCVERKPVVRGRQDFDESWFINGGVYITATDFFLTTGQFYDLAVTAVLMMKAERSFDIDTPFDLDLVRAYATFHA